MKGYLLQDWTTVRCTGPIASFTQDEEQWLPLEDYTDVFSWIDLVEVTQPSSPTGATVTLNLESAPTRDDLLFLPCAPPIPLVSGYLTAARAPIIARSTRMSSTAALAQWLRWRLSITGPVAGAPVGTWSATFRIRTVGGKSRAFVPTDLAGSLLWLRADAGITFDSGGGGGVKTWADQSGMGHDLTQTNPGNQPTWAANSVNGQPTVNFSNSVSAQWLVSAAFSVGTNTIAMVCTAQTGTVGYFWTRGTAGVLVDTLYGTTGSTIYSQRGASVSARDLSTNWGVNWSPAGARSLVVRMDGTHAGHGLRINGVDQSMTAGTAADPGVATTSDKFAVGAQDNGFLTSATHVAEVIVYDHSLSTSELAVLEEYLNRRYALY